MSIRKLLDTSPLSGMIRSASDKDYLNTCNAFSGAPRKHPYDPDKMLLFEQPFTSHTRIYEFRIADISHVDELPSIGTDTGDNLPIARIWVRKGSLGIQLIPFEVQDTFRYFEDSELLRQVMGERD